MTVKHELAIMLNNLKIEKEKTEKTIEFIQSFLTDQVRKREELSIEINVTKDSLDVLNSEENTRS